MQSVELADDVMPVEPVVLHLQQRKPGAEWWAEWVIKALGFACTSIVVLLAVVRRRV